MSRGILLATVFAAGCGAPAEDTQRSETPASRMEGTFEYVGTLKGQSMLAGGRYVFLYGLRDDGAPMTGEAGTYQIIRDTARHTVTYSTDPERIGSAFRWTPESWSGDTVTYVVLDDAGQVTGRGRSVRR